MNGSEARRPQGVRGWLPKLLTAGLLAAAAVPAKAWDYEAHRAINQLAIDSLPASFPDFVRDAATKERIGFLGGEPDRWRNSNETPLRHINAPDHFIDLEELELFDLTPADLPDLRMKYVELAAQRRAAHPERFKEINPEKNADGTRGVTGYLPWSITENYYKVKSAFSYLKALQENGYPEEIENAKANAIFYMGLLGHYVGDSTQPLHTTTHFNGWEGPNPNRYTTSRKFHQWIDGGFLSRTGGVSEADLAGRVGRATRITRPPGEDSRDPIFRSTLLFLEAQHANVEKVYALDRDQYLSPKSPKAKEGRAFLEKQLLEAANRLGSLWLTAWEEAPVDTYLRAQLLKRKLKAGEKAE